MSSLVMRKCGVCKEETIHKLNSCIYCGTVYTEPFMVLDPEVRYRRLLSMDTGGSSVRDHKLRAGRRGRAITIRSRTANHGNPIK